MSAGFGTENIIFIPAGEHLRVFDLYQWRVLTIPVTRSSVVFRPLWLANLEEQVEMIDKHLRKESENRDSQNINRAYLREFHTTVRDSSAESDHLSPDLPFIFGEKNRIWVRLSNYPCESFFTEDYQEAAEEPAEKFFPLQVYGSCSLDLDEKHEIPFPAEGENATFEFRLAAEGLKVEYIPLTEPLPIVHEFCGTEGSSALGVSVNLNTYGDISPHHQVAVAIRETDEKLYETFYFQFESSILHKVIHRLQPSAHRAWQHHLQMLGFTEQSVAPTCRIWTRDGDVIHIYHDCEGKETADVEVLPTFLVCASSSGSKQPQDREHLLNLLVATVANVPESP